MILSCCWLWINKIMWWDSECWFRLNYGLYWITYKLIILAMKYMNLIDNFVMVAKFDECKCLPINLMILGFRLLYYRYGFVDKLCTLINSMM